MVKLVIVESPAKCGKIQGFLGDDYKVMATMGHIRALEESLQSVGIERGWEPTYVELSAKKDAIARLRAAAKGVEEVLLAADDDREGESIAWHTCFVLRLNPATTRRIVFHEITRPALQAAVAAPRLLDMHKVNAQQARSMLDLLVGFTISRTLWSHVAPKLSAGRCQTPALRLVLERDAEVDGHAATASWIVGGAYGLTCTEDRAPLPPLPMEAEPPLATEAAARALLDAMHAHTALTITHAVQSVSINAPPKPLITSTLQQEASSLHGLSPKSTMQAAQKLYEAGHITYMRTDNAVLSEEAQAALRVCIVARWGETYCAAGAAAAAPARRRAPAATAATAPQAAHEAIRPTHPDQEDVGVTDAAQKTVYALIWRRAMQSQMAPARTDVYTVKCTSPQAPGTTWVSKCSKLQFAGWKVLERTGDVAGDAALWAAWTPQFRVGATLHWMHLQADQVFSRPRGRYTEASLIADLEKRGIGRPSTFASLVGTLLERGYVEKTNHEGRQQTTKHLQIAPAQWPPTETTQRHTVGADKNKLRVTPLGKSVADYLYKEFADLFAYEFTAHMEQRLDEIAQGTHAWKALLQETWDTYKERYTAATAGGAKAAAAARTRILATGDDGQILKVIQSSKGPLFVRETPAPAPATAPAAGGAGRRSKAPKPPKPKAEFAPLPSGVAFETATLADAERAFVTAAAAAAGDLLGMHGGKEIRRKKGPYGFYADMEGVRVPLRRADEPFAALVERLEAKAAAASAEGAGYERKVGDYTIKRGPYGLYMYKHTLKRLTFVKFPEALNPDTLTAVDAAAAYSNGLTKKRHAPRKTTTATKKDTE